MNACWEEIFSTDFVNWEERYRWELNQDHIVYKRGKEKSLASDYKQLFKVCEQLSEKSAYLVTIVATDERHQEDGCFKLNYVFSQETDDHFLILEYPLCGYAFTENELPGQALSGYLPTGRVYPSIRKVFAAAFSFEREVFDLFDLIAVEVDSSGEISPIDPPLETDSCGFLLHSPYPPHLAPLEVDKKVADIQKEIEGYEPQARKTGANKYGEVWFPVGPTHAGIIEAGRFDLYIAGEPIDNVRIQLGFKHRGVEKHFQTKFSLLDGWQLAEKITGDSSFSHSLAYCQAVEALAHLEPPLKAVWVRGLFLELERLYNHIGNSAALAHHVAFNLLFSEIAVLREFLMQLHAELTGHRLLRGVNRPGGVELPPEKRRVINHRAINEIIRGISRKRFGSLGDLIESFREQSELLLRTTGFRDRMFNTGTLTEKQAREIGATGLIARASGIRSRDFRVNHPFGIYKIEPSLQAMVRLPDISIEHAEEPQKPRTSGDAFSRLDVRLYEIDTSMEVIEYILERLEITQDDILVTPGTEEEIRKSENFEFALGYAEGCRGGIVYWIVKDRFNKIFRCKVLDPSFLNWLAWAQAIIPGDPSQPDTTGNIIPDAPIHNQSCELLCSGRDL